MKTKKKGLLQKWNTFFPNSSEHLRSDAHQNQIIGGMQSKYWGDISPPFPPGFGTPVFVQCNTLIQKATCTHVQCLHFSTLRTKDVFAERFWLFNLFDFYNPEIFNRVDKWPYGYTQYRRIELTFFI